MWHCLHFLINNNVRQCHIMLTYIALPRNDILLVFFIRLYVLKDTYINSCVLKDTHINSLFHQLQIPMWWLL